MKLVLDKPSYLKESINIINELVIEARFKIKHSGIELVCMDAAGICMIHFKLLKNAFNSYSLDKEIEIGLKITELKKILRKSKDKDLLIIEFENNQLILTFKGKTIRKFKLNIIELDDKAAKIPDLSFPYSIKTTSENFSTAVDVADIINDDTGVEFVAKKETLKLITETPLGSSSTLIKSDKDTIINCESEQVAKFSKEYMKKFVAGSKLSENVTLYIKTDHPMKIEFKAIDKVSIYFIIAPRVDKNG